MKRMTRMLSVLLLCCLLAGALPLLSPVTAAAPYTNAPAAGDGYYDRHALVGWEGDEYAAFTYIDGSMEIGETHSEYLTLGISSYHVPAKWYNAENYLPCLISEYIQDKFTIRVENFGDCVTVGDNDFVVIYTRMTVSNHAEARQIPLPSGQFIPLDEVTAAYSAEGAMIGAEETVVREYAVVSDSFAKVEPKDYPTADAIVALGGFDAHYAHMKAYWEERVSSLVQITSVPEAYSVLTDQYKAGYIYQMITKDGQQMNVTEEWYDALYNHDYINILSNVVQLGDFAHFDEYAWWMFNHTAGGYSDGFYKTAFPFAYYLMKTGDTALIAKWFDNITEYVEQTETNCEDSGLLNPDGTPALIMKRSISIDKRGTWLLDSQSALAGLGAYRYLCRKMYAATEDAKYKTRDEWAAARYDSLMTSTLTVLGNTVKTFDLHYLPMSMYAPNDLTNRGTSRDSNWLAIFLFGFWSWDGYLMGLEQEGNLMYEMIDDTYTYDLAIRELMNQTDSLYTPGAYGSCDFCSAYNAGYGTGGLRGELYRDWGINAAMYMIDRAQNCPNGWWENVKDPGRTEEESILWDGPTSFSVGGTGDGPHMWGQSTLTQMVVSSLIAEKADGTVIIGRGIPYAWLTDGQSISLENFAYGKGNRMGYTLTTAENRTTVKLSVTATSNVSCVLELPAFIRNISSATDGAGNALPFDSAAGSVSIPAGVTEVTVTMRQSAGAAEAVRDQAVALAFALTEADTLTADCCTATSWAILQKAVADASAVAKTKTAGEAELAAAVKSVKGAIAQLDRLTDGTVQANDELTKQYCTVGNDGYLYQTFTTGAEAGNVCYVDIWGDLEMDDSYTWDGLTLEVYALNPNKYYPYRLGESLGSASVQKGDGVDFRYRFYLSGVTLKPETTYAIAIICTYVEGSEANTGFAWHTTENVPGEYLIFRNSSNKMEERTHFGSGSYLIAYGTTATKAVLNDAARDALALELGGYTDSSAGDVTDALASIDALLRQDSFTTEEQTAALAALETAVAALERKPEQPVTEPVTVDPTGIPAFIWIVVGIGCAAVIAVSVAVVIAVRKKKC